MSNYITRVLKYVIRHKKKLLIVLGVSLINTLFVMVTPLLAKYAVDSLLKLDYNEVLLCAILILLFSVLQGVINSVRMYYTEYLTQSVTFDIRNDIYKHLHELSFSFFDKMSTGQIIARATGDVEVLRALVRYISRNFIQSIITLFFAIAMLLKISPELTLISSFSLCSILIIAVIYGIKIRPLVEIRRSAYGMLNASLQETIAGIKLIKAFASTPHIILDFFNFNKKYFDVSIKIAKIRNLLWPSVFFIVGLNTVIIYWYGGMKVIQGQISLGSLVAFTIYLGMLVWPLFSFGFFITIYQRAKVAARRVFEIIDWESEIKEKPNAITLERVKGHIKLENVWFSYDNRNWVLRGINLEIKPKEKVAIVGPPGSGKSSLIRLIPRFYDPQRGRILIDGIDIRDVKIESLRRNIGIVHQDIFIFPDTIRNNIAYGKPNASQEEIEKVAKIARIHDFIMSLPAKYNTLIGERGITLSGGQRQRIAIARALLLNPPIIIFDDSTSQVDLKTEYEIYEALKELIRDKTCIIITQRPLFISLADRIIVMKDGKIVEEGTHEELMKKNGLYAKLYREYLKLHEEVIKYVPSATPSK